MDLPAPLPNTEVAALIKRYKKGDSAAGTKVIEHNLRFAMKYASEMARRNAHLTRDDLLSVATMGMMLALKRYNPKKGSFLTYAKWWMRQQVMAEISNKEHLIRVPRNLQEAMRRGEKRRRGSFAADSRKIVEMSARCDPANPESVTVAETIPENIPDTHFMDHVKHVTGFALDRLTVRERGIIERRFGLNGFEKPQTLENIGGVYRLTRERIRQIEARAMKKLKRYAMAAMQ